MHSIFQKTQPPIIAALHLPAFQASCSPQTFSMAEITEYALRNIQRAVDAGIVSVYLQDVGDRPVQKEIQPHTIANITALGTIIRQTFPNLILGVCLMGNGARPPLAIAYAINAQFVRIKVYVGVMVKPEGLVEGCASEAIQYRSLSKIQNIQIFADIYDRTGEPLGRLPVGEAARQAVQLGRADSLVLTGSDYSDSISMLKEVRKSNLDVPLFLGGGATVDNIAEILSFADGVIVSSTFSAGERLAIGMPMEWNESRIKHFMDNVSSAR